MKKLILTAIAVVGIAASTFAQGTITIDNLTGAGNSQATSGGLFFNSDLTPFTGVLNITVLGGASAGSLSPIATLTGSAMFGLGNGQYFELAGTTYPVSGVALGATATLQVLAWTGAAATFAAAGPLEQFWAWNGTTLVNPTTFSFPNPTGGGGDPPGLPKGLEGMSAMVMVVPEPSTLALLGLGVLGLLFRRK